jgi:pimeloyl-ACP methyl ester carboxylesterase
MTSAFKWAALALLVAGAAGAADPATGYQPERRVRQSTTLGWAFAAGKGAKLPREHDSRKVRYQLFVPESYKADRTWPLVVFVPPGDAPLGWKSWSGPCKKGDYLFCAPYGAGGDCPPAQRVRILCDVLEDVCRDYRIDPDRTILVGQDNGAAVAFRLAAALPESFGGVVLINGDGPLPPLEHSLSRLAGRLSVALIAGEKERARARVEKYFAPLLSEMKVRSKLWLDPVKEGENPRAATLEGALDWLQADLKRRSADTKEHAASGPTSVLEQARKESLQARTLLRATATLEWLTERYPATSTARKAKEVLDEMDQDDQTKKKLAEHREEWRRTVLTAQAKALEKFGRLAEARKSWLEAAELGPAPQRKQAAAEARRLAAVIEKGAYLGLTFVGQTTTVKSTASGGPARLAGLRAGDRVKKIDGVAVDSPADVRKIVAAKKPGDEVEFEVERKGSSMKVPVTLGSAPVE